MTRLLLCLALGLFTTTLPAQILINEISAANISGPQDGDGDREDWVELFNSGATPVSISGWFLSDNPGNPQKWVIPAGQTINAGSYQVFYCSGKDKVAGAFIHTNFKITQTKGESLVLTRANGTIADIYNFNVPNQGDHSYGRSPSGSAAWKIFTSPTPGTANNTGAYQAYAPAVSASVNAGFYTGSTLVSLSTTFGLDIRYTTNGTEPVASSTLYSGPINISTTTVLKARAFSVNPQILPGFVTANTYFINVSHSIPVVSISGNNVGTLINGTEINPAGCFEYFENNVLKEEGYGQFNKHGNDSWVYPQRGIDWITRDQLGYKDLLKYKFFKERSRTKFQRLILKPAANDNYPTAAGAHIRDAFVHTLAIHGGLDVDARTSQSCILYVDGQYWGVYELREKVDDADFTSYYYDQDEPDIDYIKTWGPTWSEYGSSTDWYTLKAFILGNDMTVQANYDQVNQQFDLLSLIDYIIINQHSVCKDWLNWNTSWWRGRNPSGEARRWRYALWDMDATFGHYINYTGIPNTGPTADPCDVEQISNNGDPQNHIDIFMALYNNPQFKALYINRYADLLNTSLSCEYMNALLDSMVNVIAPEMARHCIRWGGTVGDWNQKVAELHDFINTRCQVLDQSIVDCYDVTGPFALTVKISPAASPNQVGINTITPAAYPYVGDYFGGVNINLLAKPATSWVFDHWEASGNTFGPDQFADSVVLAFQTTGMVTAFFVPDGPCTPPTGLAVSNPLTAPSIDWVGQPVASSYRVRYREVGDPLWLEVTTAQTTWHFDSLPGCNQYGMQIQTVCPQGESPFVDFNFDTPNHLTGFAVADAVVCNTTPTVLDATVTGATYLWDDGSTGPTRSVSSSGPFWVTAQLRGCTSTDTVMVSQINATSAVQPVLCPGEMFVLEGESFDAQHPDGQVVLQNMAVGGCDSIIQVSLQYLAPQQSQLFQKSCDPAMVGVDTLVLTSTAGCDSLVITTTTLAPMSQFMLTATSCNPNFVGIDTVYLSNHFGCDSLVITQTTFDPAAIAITKLQAQNCDPTLVGIDTLVLTSMAGCDSLVITTTTLAPMSQLVLTTTSCNPSFVGVDTVYLTNHLGCDSLLITQTTFDPAAIAITKLQAQNCDPALVGVDTLVLTSLAGCDSLVITTTTLAPMSQLMLTASSCNPGLVGTDTVYWTNHLGCDSLVITQTTFDPAAIAITKLQAQNCDPALVGVDTLVLTSLAGCDSLVITTTTLAPMSQFLLTATSCNPNFVGIDTVYLTNHFGCDSLLITQTTFDPTAIAITKLQAQNCDPVLVGVDTLVLTGVAGCDSLVITTTTLAPTSQSTVTATVCDPALVGIDTLLLANHFGCDSLVIRHTTFNGLDFDVTAPGSICFGGQDGVIRLDTVRTAFGPVTLTLENHPARAYAGAPVAWESLAGGTYLLVATNAEGCTVSQEIQVTESDALHLDLGQTSLAVHTGDSVWVEPVADFQIATASWLPVEGVQCPECLATFISADKTGDYTLTVMDTNGCTASAKLQLQVEQGVRVYVPNAIRPGSNGLNASLTIFAGPEVTRIRSLQVFDRWGNKLFEQQDLAPNVPSMWDGTFRGKLIEPGVIVWFCELETRTGEVVKRSGDVTVLR